MVEEYAKRATQINQHFLTVSDHGMLGVVPRQIKACEKASEKIKDNLSPIFACELYVNPMQPEAGSLEDMQRFMKDLDEEQKLSLRPSAHLLAIAYNETGYKNLVRLTSWGWTKGFYRRPRVNYEQLLKHKEGLFFTSCCYNSEVGRAFDSGGEDAANAMIDRYVGMFGKDHYFLELMLLDFAKQKPYDKFIVKAHERTGLKLIITNDCHYCNQEDSHFQRLMLMVQTGRTIKDIQKAMAEDAMADFFELQDTNLWLKSEEEINEKWLKDYRDIIPYELFCQAKENTVKICQQAKGVQLDRSLKLPVLPDADEILKEEVMKGFQRRGLPKSREYLDRIKEEYSLITRKGFSSYFLIQKMMTDEARRVCTELLGWGDGSQAVGPGRGCLDSEVPIIVKNGTIKPIREIKVNDLVLTRDGILRKVLNVFKYPIQKSENLVSLHVYYGDNRGVSLTQDHKVLVEKGQRIVGYNKWASSTRGVRKSIVEPIGNLDWKRADEIRVGDWLYMPIPKIPAITPEKFDLAKFEESDLFSDNQFVYQDWTNPLTKILRRRKICKRYVDFNSELFWIVVGIFAGDGWRRSDDSSRIGFALHSDDASNLAYLKAFFIDMNVDWSVKKHKNKNLKQFYINNKYIKKLFQELFDKYQFTPETKHVPDCVFTLPDRLKWAFLKGYFLSDGHQGKNKISFDSKSQDLAAQVKFLLLLLGVPASINYGKRFDKRTGKNSWCYKVNTPLTTELGLKDAEKSYFYRKVDGGLLLRVRKVSSVANSGFVYDFEVEEQHNYATSSFVVHNSAVGALVCYCLGITSVDPVYEGLLFSRFMSEARGGRSIVLEFKNMDPLSAEESFLE